MSQPESKYIKEPKRPVSLCTSLQPSPSPHRRKPNCPDTNTPSHHSAASASIPKICGSPNPPSRTPHKPCPLILSPGSPPASPIKNSFVSIRAIRGSEPRPRSRRTLSSYPKWHGHSACDLSRQRHRRGLSHCPPMGSCCQSRWFGYCEREAVISIEFQAVGRKRHPAERPVCRWIFHQI
jgi:hypothetical protein